MPIYALKCRGCGKVNEQFHRMAEVDRARSDCCQDATEIVPQRFTTDREYHGEESCLDSLAFDPAGQEELKRELPSFEGLTDDGRVKIKNDRHHRKILKEFNAARDRYQMEDEQRMMQLAEDKAAMQAAEQAVEDFLEKAQ